MSGFWTDKRVLVTGGAGYLASSLVNLLKDRAASIVRLDRPGAEFMPLDGSARMENVVGDIRDPAFWQTRAGRVNILFHLAAQTSAARADADPEADKAVNLLPVLALIETCRRLMTPPVILLAGTATECGLTDHLPVDESVPDSPITAYDRHKLAAEQALEQAVREGILHATTLRLSNLYGPGPSSSSADRGILNRMMRRALAGEPLTIYGMDDYVRDYLYVEDAARAFLTAAEHIEDLSGSHFLIGSGTGTTICEAFDRVAERVALRTGRKVDVTRIDPPRPLPAIETRNYIADTARFAQQTGWRAEIDLKTGIDRTLAFYEGEGR
ncbi:MAG: NAD-dependent epimerase/dehydratase family protein [Kiritimatiellia bacterium]|jgi:nucleoside-diphosphate-sugar epimerase|nr:NAD-dependent epimerase/dehydratase family protein [Kiritimatiellia bacterium]